MAEQATECDYYEEDCEPEFRYCHTCGGQGVVDSVVDETGRYGWDEDAPGTCPNCRGSGDAVDCWYW